MLHQVLFVALLLKSILAFNLNPSDDLNSFGNNTLFDRWRPRYHFIAPSGWQNDPNGAMYDSKRGVYRLFYQFHPNHVDWGNISWGLATSKDLITWVDTGGWQDDRARVIGTGPSGSYDHLGVFSGTAQPYSLHGQQDGNLTIFYTSVNTLPINQLAETQSLATSADGLTWDKYEANPVIIEPPEGWNVTGWRDPFFLPWPALDDILGQQDSHFYVAFGTGIINSGPRISLYSAPSSDLTSWKFLGALLDVPIDFSWGGDSSKSGSFGSIFECPGMFSLVEERQHGGDGHTLHYFVNMGTQGSGQWSLWAEGQLSKRGDGSAQFDILSSNPVDWGNLYAVQSFWDAKNGRRVAWGWSAENMNEYGVKAQGFQGSMGLPREFFVQTLHGVIAPPSGVPTNSSATWKADAKGTYIVMTLGTRPLPDVITGLHDGKPLNLQSSTVNASRKITNVRSDHFHLTATISNLTGESGFIVRASPGLEEYTTISYSPQTSRLSVNRTSSSLIPQFSSDTISGYFPLYQTIANGLENISMDIFVDGSLIEVFLNERFALTTRIYPSRDDALEIWQYVQDGGTTRHTAVQIWTEMLNVWPHRPLNSSSPLVWDTAKSTDNGIWWSGI